MGSETFRADVLIVRRGFCESREKAQELISSGVVKINGITVTKASLKFPEDADIQIDKMIGYVSRGYLKIKWAYEKLGFSCEGKVCADIGASTGGFTQFLIEMGAKKVYSIDVGKGLLHQSLVENPKVVVMEGVDAKNLSPDMFAEKVEFATVDVSFSSSIPIVRAIKFIPEVLLLCKPNFEVPRRYLKKGILKDKDIIFLAIKKVISNIEDIFWVDKITFSNPPGSSGNVEFFLLLKTSSEISRRMIDDEHIRKVINEAFSTLDI